MFEAWTENLSRIIETNPWLAPLAAFLGGLLTAANPCVLAMAPLMVAYVAGQDNRGVLRSFLISLTFTIGLTITFGVMFLATFAASSAIDPVFWKYVASRRLFADGFASHWGADLAGSRRFTLAAQATRFPGAFVLGLLFGLASMPCAGPVLVVLLATVPMKGAAFGCILLAAYSLGHCGLVLAGGTSMGLVQKLADSKGWTQGINIFRKIAGIVIILIGMYLLMF